MKITPFQPSFTALNRRGTVESRAPRFGNQTQGRELPQEPRNFYADILHTDKVEAEKLFLVAAFQGDAEAVTGFIKAGVDINVGTGVNRDGWTATMYAADRHTDILKLLIASGANLNRRDKQGITATMIAACNPNEQDRVPLLKMLIQAGANLNLKNNDGKTALMLAQEKGYIDVVTLLTKN